MNTLAIANKIWFVVREIGRLTLSLLKTISRLVTLTVTIFGILACALPIVMRSEYPGLISQLQTLTPEQIYLGHLATIKLCWFIALIYYPIAQVAITFYQLNGSDILEKVRDLKSLRHNSRIFTRRYLRNYFCYWY